MKQLCYLVLFWGILQISCSKSPTEKEENNIPSEDTGVWLHDYGMNAGWVSLNWSKNTNELFTVGDKGIQAIDLSTLSVRTIYRTDGYNTPQASRMALSNDGNTIYYRLSGPSSCGPLYSISIDVHDRQLLDDSECCDLCLSPDDLYLAYCAYYQSSVADSLYTYEIDSKEKKFLCIGRPITFSPDSRSLLYYYLTHPDTSQYAIRNYSIISIENGETNPVSFDIEDLYLYCFFWGEDGIYIAHSPEYGQGAVRNITTNHTIFSWEEPVYVKRTSYIFSPQGNKVAFWINAGWWQPDYSLYVVDLNLETYTCIAYSEKRGRFYSTAFSPDEKRIAYVFGESIYMKEIP